MNLPFWYDTLRTVAATATAIAAVVGLHKYRSEIESARRLKWQKTAIQSIIQNVDDRISFSDLKDKFRSLAADQRKLLRVSDISEQALRMILIDLCRENVIVQLGSDTYALTTYPGQIEKNQALNAEMLALQKVFFQAQLEFMAKTDQHTREMLEEFKKASVEYGISRPFTPGVVFGKSTLGGNKN